MNNIVLRKTRIRAVLTILVTVFMWPVPQTVAQQYKTYNEAFTEESGRAYKEDINVWVYTSGFAKRFAMPEQWVDKSLKGALAIAYRVEERAIKTRLAHKGPNVSMPIRDCIFDIYMSSDVNIPWIKKDKLFRVYEVPHSAGYLLGQNKEDWEWRTRWLRKYHVGKDARKYLTHFDGGSLTLRGFDSEIFPGIMLASFKKGCWRPPKKSVVIEFCRDKPWQGVKCDAYHSLTLPEAYMKRVYDYWYEKEHKKSVPEYNRVLRGSSGVDKPPLNDFE